MGNPRILIVKIGATGDVVMTLPVLTALRKKYHNPEITWICGKLAAPVLKKIPFDINIIEVDEYKLFGKSKFNALVELVRIYLNLPSLFFTGKYIFYKHFAYRFAFSLVFAKKTKHLSPNNNRGIPVLGRSMPFEFVRLITGSDDSNLPAPALPEVNLSDEKNIRAKFGLTGNYIVLTPAGAKNFMREGFLRGWEVQNYRELAVKLISEGFEVVITGSEDDRWVSEEFSGVNIINLTGKTALDELIDVFAYADLVVAHDSGPLHLAQLSGAKVVALFGPTNPKELTHINFKGVKPIYISGGENLFCSPCFNQSSFPNCTNNLCMKNIQVKEVFNLVKQFVNKDLYEK
ncbi:MAG: glycosyltransferase family 9 protein [Ignavibacteriaceae bacterium]|nr:glycosyltransferase family 9 protein [Ignavibacteriaceae bacterium]